MGPKESAARASKPIEHKEVVDLDADDDQDDKNVQKEQLSVVPTAPVTSKNQKLDPKVAEVSASNFPLLSWYPVPMPMTQ